ncbi:MAG: EAL domain-containing protein, partial [Burkholderiales bacterium]|nr:EAL domain-containing protein [Burkholderiales bacterium]
EVAARLRGLAREGDTVARIGGDEYVLMVEASGPPEQCRAQAQRLVAELARPLRIADLEFVVSASVGVSVHPDHGAADKLLAHADAAMYAAKRAGGGRCVLYHPGMDESAFDQLSLQTELRQAIEQGALELHYQPKIDARSGATVGVEALLRWHHPERGPVSPAVFVPVAERFGLIGALGDWVIDEACRQMGVWAEAGMAVSVAINLSVHQLRREGLAAYIDAALRRRRVAPSQLLCEITESVAMDDLGASLPVFEQLLAIGVYLSIDDFGTGYSSLSYLRRLPARQLKIDRSFVHDLEASADARAIVQAVLGVAHALGLSVVAEGVETAGQCKILRALGCDELQGYLFARPMPAAELPDWLALRSGQRFADEIEPVLAEEQRVADEAARSAENAA